MEVRSDRGADGDHQRRGHRLPKRWSGCCGAPGSGWPSPVADSDDHQDRSLELRLDRVRVGPLDDDARQAHERRQGEEDRRGGRGPAVTWPATQMRIVVARAPMTHAIQTLTAGSPARAWGW